MDSNSAALIQAVATVILVLITGWYALSTHWVLKHMTDERARQQRGARDAVILELKQAACACPPDNEWRKYLQSGGGPVAFCTLAWDSLRPHLVLRDEQAVSLLVGVYAEIVHCNSHYQRWQACPDPGHSVNLAGDRCVAACRLKPKIEECLKACEGGQLSKAESAVRTR
jgi:hypothetical protein